MNTLQSLLCMTITDWPTA